MRTLNTFPAGLVPFLALLRYIVRRSAGMLAFTLFAPICSADPGTPIKVVEIAVTNQEVRVLIDGVDFVSIENVEEVVRLYGPFKTNIAVNALSPFNAYLWPNGLDLWFSGDTKKLINIHLDTNKTAKILYNGTEVISAESLNSMPANATLRRDKYDWSYYVPLSDAGLILGSGNGLTYFWLSQSGATEKPNLSGLSRALSNSHDSESKSEKSATSDAKNRDVPSAHTQPPASKP